MRVVIVDYGAGNLRSVQRACHQVGISKVLISADPEVVNTADKVIFPGVGSAISAIDTLHASGLFAALVAFYQSGKPLLGICLGCQIMLSFTEEGNKNCLGLLDGVCQRFDFVDKTLKVPHIGWNSVKIQRPHPMLQYICDGDEFYFVHAYFVSPCDTAQVIGVTHYGHEFCSILAKENLFATQFHLEKSGQKGLAILNAFRFWDG